MFLFLNPKFHILCNNNFSLLTSTRNNIKKISIPPKHTSPFSLLISERFNERKATRKSEFRHSKDDVDAGIRALPSGVSAPPDPDQEEEEEDRNSLPLPLPSPPSLPQSRNKAERDSSPIGTRGRKRANKRTKRKIGVLQRCKGDECRRRSRRCQACRASSP